MPGGAFASGASAATTNQRMEIEAAYEAVQAIPGSLTIVSDSTYVVNCFRDGWWKGWHARGWLNSQKKPVANRDLWEPFVDLVQVRGDVTFQWIKGHSGDPMNDLVDRLAVEAAETQRGRSGEEPPTELGPADRPGPAARKAARRTAAPSPGAGSLPAPVVPSGPDITGYGVLVLGHRPPELGGYEDNPISDAVRGRLQAIIEAKAALHDDLVVVTGLRLGAEMLGAEAAIAAGVPFVAVLPYPDPQRVWPTVSQGRFSALLDDATEVITLQKRAPDSKQQAGAALARRDAWLARHVAEALLVWDGKDPVLSRVFRSLEDHLGEDVWTVDPTELATRRGSP